MPFDSNRMSSTRGKPTGMAGCSPGHHAKTARGRALLAKAKGRGKRRDPEEEVGEPEGLNDEAGEYDAT